MIHCLSDLVRDADILEIAVRVGAQLKRITTTEWAGACPACGGKDRFSVNIQKRLFICRGGGGGDVIAMAQHVLGIEFRDAIAFITGDRPNYLPSQKIVSAPIGSERRSVPPIDERRRIARVTAIWLEAKDPRDTIVEGYLNSRELLLAADVAGVVLRYHPACPWRDKDNDATITVPAMIAAMRSIARDDITAIHRTRLSEDGQKIERRMLGQASGAAIKLDPDDTVQSGLHIGEGIETCLAARQLGLKPTWALGSTSFVAAFPVLSGIECLTLLAENDAASSKAIEACGQRWHDADRVVMINRPIRGNDLNDAIRGAA